MNASAKIDRILKRYDVGFKQLQAMLNVTTSRLSFLQSGVVQPTKSEIARIELVYRIAKRLSCGMDFDEEIRYQKEVVESLTATLCRKIPFVSIESSKEMLELIVSLTNEAMYLGVAYANNNQEEIVTEQVRKVRQE